jgi:DNA-binding NtrC family response regulator
VVLGDLLRKEGYEVDVCRDLNGAKKQLRRDSYELVIVNLFDGSDAALHACKELRSIRPEQKVAFIQGRWTAIPAEACQHYLIPLQENTRDMLAKLAEVLQRPQRRSYSCEPSGEYVNS